MIRLIGIGNPARRDDGAGRSVAALLLRRHPEADVRQIGGEMTALMQIWEGANHVILIDAVCSGSPPGTVHHLTGVDQPLPDHAQQTSTHGFGLAQAVEMACALGTLPTSVDIYGIEGADFSIGEGLSPLVAQAVIQVADAIGTQLEGLKEGGG